MRRLRYLLVGVFAVIVMGLSTSVFAEDGIPSLPNDWITWDFLGTFAGIVVVTAALTQVLKMLPFKLNDKIDPKWYSIVVSIILNCGLQFLSKKDFTPDGIFIMCVNILVVFAASVGAYEVIVKPVQRKLQDNNNSK